jgi:hypothetical protein
MHRDAARIVGDQLGELRSSVFIAEEIYILSFDSSLARTLARS